MEAKENSSIAGFQQHIGRITRSRAAASCANGGAPPLVPLMKPDPPKRKTTRGVSDENAPEIMVSSNLGIRKGKPKNAVSDTKGQQKGRAKRPALADIKCDVGMTLNVKMTDLCAGTKKARGKRPATDVNTHNGAGTTLIVPNKRRATLREASNVLCDGVLIDSSFPVPKAQTKVFPEGYLGIFKSIEEAKSPAEHKKPESKNVEDLNLHKNGSKEVASSVRHSNKDGESIGKIFLEESSSGAHGFFLNADTMNGDTTSSGIVNIDCEKSNARMCSIYASDIYSNFRANELIRRPSSDFLERLQTDVTQNMRAVLVDWLVEVCDEYCLVPDTLYLTVYLIDRFLSMNKIERQRLQLLGITCMLIASKYEEICAPRVQEFCFITDNSYSKAEVLKMERQVLSLVGYNISIPTTKIFLRRFLRAAQASSKAHPALMHLTNYLAELTLVEYSFLEFLPSVIASAAVFLAQWTLDQSTNPWNITLQHYTSYRSCDIKNSILALRDLQVNTKNCTLKAIRQKYQQDKFSSVACLTSPELPDSLFC
ncbi:cyclin-A2-1-like protein [Carex littledalei]|uniref:Cyclin-A2-1-like protein n=1 Tax=Carex littledalei TaxID=544730 RepID=A0A833R7K9_9POAL|nr:cyclin-A2-1-like protein [Carex littledalei]